MEEQQTPPKPPGFWKRQFSDEVTRPQVIYDSLMGGVIPILLLAIDPGIFRAIGECYDGSGLQPFRIFAYLGIGAGVITLAIWLGARKWLPVSATGTIAGIMFAGSLFASGIGISLLPVSVSGLILVLGALGFIPFITAFTYFRNGVRAVRRASQSGANKIALAGFALGGALAVLGLPAIAQWQIAQIIDVSVAEIADGDITPEDNDAVQHLITLNAMCLGQCRDRISGSITDVLYVDRVKDPHVAEAFEKLQKSDRKLADCTYYVE